MIGNPPDGKSDKSATTIPEDVARIQVVLQLPVKPGSTSCIGREDDWCRFLCHEYGKDNEDEGFGCDLFDAKVPEIHDEAPRRLPQCIAAEVQQRPDGTVTWLHLSDSAR